MRLNMKGKLITILSLTFVFYSTFVARIIFGPLLPIVEKDLALSHAASGAIFFWVSSGLFVSSVLSGLFSYIFSIRYLVYFASFGIGLTLLTGIFIKSLTSIYVVCVFIGFFAGFYLSAGIAIITSIVEKKYWGKALSIHELAPNLSFVSAPFIAEILIRFMHWRYVLLVLGFLAILSGILFLIFGQGGDSKAKGVAFSSLFSILSRKQFWIMALLFGFCAGAAMGVFSMLPLFLVTEKGFVYKDANYLVGFSRLFAILAAFISGIITDKIGFKKVIFSVVVLASICTVLLAFSDKSLIPAFVLLQPFFAQGFFPAGFAALSHLSTQDERAMIVGLTIPIGVLIGAGGFPWIIGFVGDRLSLKMGLLVVALIIGTGALLVKALRESRV